MAWANTATSKGKITKAFADEVQAAITKAQPARGTGSTGGEAGVTITLAAAEPSTNYDVMIYFGANPGPNVGAWWIASKTTAGFKVHNVGDSGVAFTYVLTRY